MLRLSLWSILRSFPCIWKHCLFPAAAGLRCCALLWWRVDSSSQWCLLWNTDSRAPRRQYLCHVGLVALHYVSSSQARDRTCALYIGRWVLNHWITTEVLDKGPTSFFGKRISGFPSTIFWKACLSRRKVLAPFSTRLSGRVCSGLCVVFFGLYVCLYVSAHCFDYCSFVVSFEIRKCSLFFFLNIALAIWGPFRLHMNFRISFPISAKKKNWDFSVFVWAAQLAVSKAPKNSRKRWESLPQWSVQGNREKQ